NSDKVPRRGCYIRPDRGYPSRHFLFAEDGKVRASRNAAKYTIADLELNRRWLADERKQNIDTMLALLNEAVRLCQEGHPEPARRLARTLLRSIDAPRKAYSIALSQCFWRAWKKANAPH